MIAKIDWGNHMIIKDGNCRKAFQQKARKYVINMVRGSKKTLHIKNTSCCQWSKFLLEYVDFDSLDNAKSSGIDFEPCKKCFK